MTEQEKQAAANPPIRCACGREELLTPASPLPADAGSVEQRAQDERPGPQPPETAITAGPVKRNEERH
jgi:hypothetical protein